MKRRFVLLLSLFVVLNNSCQHHSSDKLIIASAANMQFALEKLIPEFESKYNISCDVILGSSGKLAAQIQAGAPYDIFLSADKKYPESLEQKGLTKDTPKVYAKGKLVLWSLDFSIKSAYESLSSESIKHIAIANPKTAPYGLAAQSFLSNIGLEESLKEKLVFGESVSQVNQFVLSGAANLGITAKSVVLSDQIKNVGHWISLDTSLYDPLYQHYVILNSTPKKMILSNSFVDFLKSQEAKNILKESGYGVD